MAKLKNYMIKPSLKVVNFNIDYKLPKKEVEYNKTQVMMYGRIQDIDKRFPGGKEKVVEPKEGTPDPSADVPVFGGPLIPISLSAAVGKATQNVKAVAGVALSSVGSMASGLKALAGGSSDELVALAKLDKVILESMEVLGEISTGNADKLKKGIDGDILKASSIKDAGSLGDALGSIKDKLPGLPKLPGDLTNVGGSLGLDKVGNGLGIPSIAKAVDANGVTRNFNIDKTQGFRDVLQDVQVRVDDGVTESFTTMKKTVRVYGSETDLNSKFGNVNQGGADVTTRRALPENVKSSNTTSISKRVWRGDFGWEGQA